MEVHQIRYFLAIVREGSFGRAATACRVSQPSVTRAIHKLERELGGPLLDRSRNVITLTRLGRLVAPRLHSIAQQLDGIETAARRRTAPDRTRIGLGLLDSLDSKTIERLVKVVSQSQATEVAIETGNARELAARLAEDAIDVAVTTLDGSRGAAQQLELFTEPFGIACPEDHAVARLPHVPASMLRDLQLMDLTSSGFDEALRSAGAAVSASARCSSHRVDLVAALIERRACVSIMSERTARSARLTFRPLSEPVVVRHIGLMVPHGQAVSPAIDALLARISATNWR